MIRKSLMAAVLLPTRTLRSLAFCSASAAGDPLGGLLLGPLDHPLRDLRVCLLGDLVGELLAVQADDRQDAPGQPLALDRQGVERRADAVGDRPAASARPVEGRMIAVIVRFGVS